jgi:hypothetical protein
VGIGIGSGKNRRSIEATNLREAGGAHETRREEPFISKTTCLNVSLQQCAGISFSVQAYSLSARLSGCGSGWRP